MNVACEEEKYVPARAPLNIPVDGWRAMLPAIGCAPGARAAMVRGSLHRTPQPPGIMTALFYAHSGLRYLVLIAALVALIHAAVQLGRSRPPNRADRVLFAAFAGLLDLQIVLGILLAATGIFYPQLIGHILLMVLAAVTVHAASIVGRRSTDARSHWIRISGVLVAVGLIAAGIMAAGRTVLGTGAPSVIG